MALSENGGVPFTMNVEPAGSANRNGGFFGGDGSWFIILFLVFAMFGWGGYGVGGNGNGGGAAPGYVLTSDFSNIERKIDGVNSGLCDGFYQQAQLINGVNQNMNNGFAAVTSAVTNGFSAAEVARCNAQMAFMQQFNAIQTQIANCCCENREAIAQVRYDMATQGCDTRNLIQSSTRDIVDAFNAGIRSIDQRLASQELAAKDAQIRAQEQRLFMAELRASQEAQNGYLLGALRPLPVPAYQVQNPNCCYQQCGGCC